MKILVFDNTASQSYVGDFSGIARNTSVSTRVPGLYHQLSFTISDSIEKMYSAFKNYLGYRVVLVDNDGTVSWDGIIWSLELGLGDETIGPYDLEFVENYVAVEYSDILNDNRYGLTSYISNAVSQARYGIKEGVPSYGGITSSAATALANKYSTNHAEPYIGGSFSAPVSGSGMTLTINCQGWWATAGYRKFNSQITTTCTNGQRVIEIVNRTVVPAAPGTSYYLQFFSTDTSLITDPGLTIARATLHTFTTASYLEQIISLGDASYNTYFIGAEIGSSNGTYPIGSPRVRVWARPSSPQFYISAEAGCVYNASMAKVSPLRIRAGDFVQFIDIVPEGSTILTPKDGSKGFVVVETEYDVEDNKIRLKPEGTDTDVNVILARMRG